LLYKLSRNGTTLKIKIHEHQEQGAREYQQDRYWYHTNEERTIFALADGMGGQDCGDEAADTCIYAVSILRNKPIDYFTHENINNIFYTAHAVCMAAGDEWDDRGATLIICVITQDLIRFWNIGDSYGYVVLNDNSYIQAQTLYNGWIGAFTRHSCNQRYSWNGKATLTRPPVAVTYTEIPNNDVKYVVVASDGIDKIIIPETWDTNKAYTIAELGLESYARTTPLTDNTSVLLAEITQ
jgi:hypothetical protein